MADLIDHVLASSLLGNGDSIARDPAVQVTITSLATSHWPRHWDTVPAALAAAVDASSPANSSAFRLVHTYLRRRSPDLALRFPRPPTELFRAIVLASVASAADQVLLPITVYSAPDAEGRGSLSTNAAFRALTWYALRNARSSGIEGRWTATLDTIESAWSAEVEQNGLTEWRTGDFADRVTQWATHGNATTGQPYRLLSAPQLVLQAATDLHALVPSVAPVVAERRLAEVVAQSLRGRDATVTIHGLHTAAGAVQPALPPPGSVTPRCLADAIAAGPGGLTPSAFDGLLTADAAAVVLFRDLQLGRLARSAPPPRRSVSTSARTGGAR